LQNRQRHIGLLVVLAAAVALSLPALAWAWTWPVEGPVLQSYVFDELNPKAPGQHRGISIGAAVGTPVRAPVDATITFAGTVPSGGKTLSLLTTQGLSVTLLHLGSFNVAEGATVAEGDVVGSVGPSAGSVLGQPFVYLGVRRVDDPQGYLDPMLFLPAPTVDPPPVEPPASDPAPAPVAPPAGVTPPAPPAAQRPVPQLVGPPDPAPLRPSAPVLSDVPNLPAPSPTRPAGASLASDLPPVHLPAITRMPADGVKPALVAARPAAPAAPRPALVDRNPAPSWLRPLDQLQASAPGPSVRQSSEGAGRHPLELLVASLAALALLLLFARRGRGGGARIIGGDAVLPDNADLLREREPAHRARVHDDRRGRTRPAPQAAR
jgi:hypothetical protein